MVAHDAYPPPTKYAPAKFVPPNLSWGGTKFAGQMGQSGQNLSNMSNMSQKFVGQSGQILSNMSSEPKYARANFVPKRQNPSEGGSGTKFARQI